MIPYAKHQINDDDIKAVTKSLKSKNLTQGKEVKLFEQDLKKFCDSKFATVVNSCTSALHISCLALNLKRGDYLWTTSVSFVASANCGLYCGAKVDFIDINLNNYNIDVDALSKKLQKAKLKKKLPKIIVVVHLGGEPCEMRKIFELSKKYDFRIIEDACHALSAKYKKHKIGSCKYSDITTFSFHAIKNVTSGEGGAVLTNSQVIADKLNLLRSHGITFEKKFFVKRKFKILPTHYEQVLLGYNYRMTDFQAALARSQLKRLKEIIKKRRKIVKYYNSAFKDLPLITQDLDSKSKSGYHLYILRMKTNKTKKTRLQLVNHLNKNDIQVGFHYIPIFTHRYFKPSRVNEKDFPNTEVFSKTAFSLPLYNQLSKKNLKYIVKTVKDFFKK